MNLYIPRSSTHSFSQGLQPAEWGLRSAGSDGAALEWVLQDRYQAVRYAAGHAAVCHGHRQTGPRQVRGGQGIEREGNGGHDQAGKHNNHVGSYAKNCRPEREREDHDPISHQVFLP